MKRFLYIILAVLTVFSAAVPMTAFALDFDPHYLYVDYENAPEGTVYADVLVKFKDNDSGYREFTSPPERLEKKYTDSTGNTRYIFKKLDITENSEIALLNIDGYSSLTLHSGEVKKFTIYKEDYSGSDEIVLECNAEDLYRKYRHFRIAYVDGNGKVLQITNKSHGKNYDLDNPYAVTADGDSTSFRYWGISPFELAIPVCILVLIAIIPAFIVIKNTVGYFINKE